LECRLPVLGIPQKEGKRNFRRGEGQEKREEKKGGGGKKERKRRWSYVLDQLNFNSRFEYSIMLVPDLEKKERGGGEGRG